MAHSISHAASGTWTGAQNVMWTNSANWNASPYAGYNTGESATFNSSGNNNTNLNIAGLYSLMNITFDTANVAAYTIGTDAPAGQRIVIGSNGNYKLTSSAANSQTFKAAVMLGGGATTASYTFQNDNTSQLLTFNEIIVTNTGTPGTKTLTVTGAGTTAILGHITKGTATGITLTKTSTGTLTLAGTNVVATLNVNGGTLALTGPNGAMAIAGTVAVASGATLRLDNTASDNNANRLFDASPISLTGGTLAFAHSAGAANYSETAGTVTLNGSGNVISASPADEGQTSALTLSGLIQNTAATVNFTGAGLGESDCNRIFITGQADGPLGPWATLNGAAPVLYDSASGVHLQASTDIAAYGDTILSNDTANVRINSEGTTGPIELSDTVTVINSLMQNTAFGTAVNTAGKTLQLSALSIYPSMADLAIGVSPNDGAVTPKIAGGTLSLANDSASTLTINAVLTDNESPGSLAKSGAGPAVLAGANTFSGSVSVSEGSLLLSHSLALQNVLLNSLSGIVFDSSVSDHAFTVGGLTNAFALALEDSAANPIVLSVGNNGADSSFGGVLSGAGTLNKVGAGTLVLTAASTHTGGTAISAGTLRVTQKDALGPNGVTNNATLDLPLGYVSAGYGGMNTAMSGTGTVNVAIGAGSELTPFDGDYSGFAGVWNIGVGAAAGAGKIRLNGADNPAATVNVLPNSTLYVGAPVVHRAAAVLWGGNVGQTYGQLRLDSGAEWAGPVTLAGDITDAADGFFGCYTGTGTVSGVVSDLGGAHPVKKLNGTVFNLTCPTNTYAGQTWINEGTLGVASIRNVGETSSLGQPANADDGTIKIGNGGAAARLAYLGSGDTTDRTVDLAGTTGGAYLEQAGSGLLVFTSDFIYSGQGNKTLYLQGSTEGVGELACTYANGTAATNKLIKSGTGKWTLSESNTYSGETEIQDGTLILSHPAALVGTSQVKFTGTAIRNAVLELANDSDAQAPFYTIMGVGYLGTIASGVATGNTGINHTLGDISLSGTTLTVCRAANVLSGSPAVTFGTLGLNGGNTYTTVLKPTDADLHIGSVAILAGSFGKTLRLDGDSTGNTITGAVYNGLSTLSLYKSGASTWTLQGSNTFSGATTVNSGSLVLSGEKGALASSSSFTVNTGGTLVLSNTDTANNTNRLADTKALTLNGGTVDFSHAAGNADYSEKVGTVTVSGTGNVIRVSQAATGRTSALTLNALTRNANATLLFEGIGLGTDDRNRLFINGQTPGLFGLWATCNGDKLAVYDTALGVYAGTESTTEIAAKGPFSTIPNDATADVRITTAGDAGPIVLAGTAENSVALLQQCTDTAATVDTAAKTLRTHALIINTNQASLTLGQNAGDGALTALAPGGRLDLMNDDSVATLTVNAEVADNGSSSSLAKSGPGGVVLNGTTSYSGPTAITMGTLTFGGHADPQVLVGVVSGAGSLAKNGTNLLHLLASNTFSGPTTVNAGTLRVNQNAALGTSAEGTVIADGATLDVGCTPDVGGTRTPNQLNMQGEPITVQGAGVGGLGAIINSSTGSQYNALGKITLAGDTVFGARSRWDVRDSWMVMNDHTLTKVGPDVFSLSSSPVTPGEAGTAAIDVQEGQFRLQRTTTLGGSAANTLFLRSGTQFEFFEVVNDVGWSLSLDDGSAIDILSSAASTQNRLTGPATLNGEVSLIGSDSQYGTLAGDISGTGSLTKTNGVYFYVTGTNNTYAGPTLIRGGALYISSLRSVGEPCSLGQPANAADGTIPIGSGSASARLIYLGSGDTSDRVIDMAGTSGGVYLEQAGEGLLKLRELAVSGVGAKTLYLQGSTSGVGEISGAIPNSASGSVTVNKSGTGAWILSGNNTYSGSTTVDAGSLTYSGTNVLGALTLNAGTVSILGTNAYGSSSITVGTSSRNGTLILGNGASLSSSGSFRIGSTSGNGALYINGASFLNTASDSDANFVFARENNSYGYLKMTGGSVAANRFQMSGVANTSNIGRSLARIVDGVLSFSAYVLIGRNPGCETVLTMDGGLFNHANASQNFGIAWAGGRSELNLTGGAVDNTGKSVSVMQGGGNSATGIVNLCSGTLTTASVTNYGATSVAILNFAGGTLKASANHTAFLPSGLSSVYSYGPFGTYAGGAVIDTAGKNVTIMAPVQAPAGQGVAEISLVDQGSGYTGEPYVCIDGDGLGACAVANMADDGTGNGTYKVASVTVTCPGVNYTSTPTVLLKGGGFNIVTAQVGTVTLIGNTSGGLTKQGNGTLTLGAANTYAGPTTVGEGTLKLSNAEALPTGTQVTLAGGMLDLNGSLITNAVNGSGTLANGTVEAVLSPAGEDVIGSDTLTLTGVTLQGLYRADVTADGDSDIVTIQGDINLANLSLQLVDPDQLDRHQTYTILSCTGTRTGTFSSTNLPDSRWHAVYLSDGTVKLIYASGTLISIH